MLINSAYAQSVEITEDLITGAPEAPSAMEAFVWNMGLVAILVGMFYILLIRPQQKRMKEHNEMLQGLQKGDRVVTAGGLIGKITKIKDGDDEVQVELEGGTSVVALRSMLQKRDVIGVAASKIANDDKAETPKAASAKKSPAKKAPAKKAAPKKAAAKKPAAKKTAAKKTTKK